MEAREYISQLIERGWTQVQIAQRTDIAQPTISKVMRGEVKDVMSVNYRKLQALHADALERGDEAAKAGPPPENAATPEPTAQQGA